MLLFSRRNKMIVFNTIDDMAELFFTNALPYVQFFSILSFVSELCFSFCFMAHYFNFFS